MQDFHLLINGELTSGDLTMDVVNPATEDVIAACPRASEAQLLAAVAAAKSAFVSWSTTKLEERRNALRSIAEVIDLNAHELARLLTQEQGKPLSEAIAEIGGASAFFRYFAELDLTTTVLEDGPGKRVELRRRPLGVVGAIVPWNYPMALMAFKVPPALLAGNTIVLKPAATTPLSTLRFAELVRDLLPPGVLNVIADANDLGSQLVSHPDVRKVSFTGSTETGKRVLAGAAQTLKRVTLELGGNDAAIVLDDVNPSEIAPRLFKAAFENAGQICIAAKRLYVHEKVYDELCDALARLADDTIVADGLQQGTQLGPLQNKAQFEKVLGYIEVGRRDGNIVAGGTREGEKGYFVRPTIVRDIVDGSKLVDEEQFGPVMPVIKFRDVEDALARANASPYGLGGSIWTGNPDRARELAERMDTGTVWINTHVELAPGVPFAGAKMSGIGSELGQAGLAEFTQVQVLNFPTPAI